MSSSTGRLVLLLGGARSGKSRLAEKMAREAGGDSVTYLATAEVSDDEMAHRVERHRADRPQVWQTLEEPLHAAKALSEAEHETVLLDCITLLASNHLLGSGAEAAHDEIARLIETAKTRAGTLIVVSNEVGDGIVPMNALARRFRDLQGTLNQQLAAAADTVVLVVAGLPLTLKGQGQTPSTFGE